MWVIPTSNQCRNVDAGLWRRRYCHGMRCRGHDAYSNRYQLQQKLGLGVPIPKSYFSQYEFTSQFEGAERIAELYNITRDDTDALALSSQQRAARAWAQGHFDGQWIPVTAPDLDEEGKPTGTTHTVSRDEGIRESSLESLAKLKPVGRENGVHTAGNSSQISDGAAALLMMTEQKATKLGLTPRARVVDTCLVGVDPVLMLTGPIEATKRLLERNKLGIDDIDTFEINEAFASVVLGWARATGADLEKQTPTVERLHLDIHLAVPDPFSSQRRYTNSSASVADTRSSQCVVVADSAPEHSSNASNPRRA